ncbi:MAG TPA: gluconate 2-dehydrogenase subunit 3 family protein [Polyangiales bacterium]|nr:gluconate 2-dehydrogenase subunit 3 family protein [Polyangiales bacterium]
MNAAGSYRFFTPQSLAVFRAAAGCIVPSEPGSPGADTEAALTLADAAIADRPARDRRLLGVFLHALQWLPVPRFGRSFTKLSREQQARVLAFLESTTVVPKLRQGFFGLKTFALLGYYGSETTFAELHYPGPRQDAPFYVNLRASRARQSAT